MQIYTNVLSGQVVPYLKRWPGFLFFYIKLYCFLGKEMGGTLFTTRYMQIYSENCKLFIEKLWQV